MISFSFFNLPIQMNVKFGVILLGIVAAFPFSYRGWMSLFLAFFSVIIDSCAFGFCSIMFSFFTIFFNRIPIDLYSTLRALKPILAKKNLSSSFMIKFSSRQLSVAIDNMLDVMRKERIRERY